ncbi:restriction endonuclease subunit S [Methanosarcina mazei]|uniref:Type I restriction-modification system, specificity subunit S n=1 Tax=Methanosarcina mazei SarPi TaxID=1434115 RepID=A0A0E3R9J9_METMZ|nr:restriction endonuclease subunit S [Methanosarcina mazei]AKB62015.1 Type I restriction-modification system, specificity subunit S [Methanosarcina mazei SarPi]
MKENRELPEGWEWKRLGDVCDKPQYGYTTSASNEVGGPLFVRTTDITNGMIDWNKVPYCSEPPENKEKYLLHDGDILISRAGSVGSSIVVKNPKDAIFASYLIRFTPTNKIVSDYLGYFLKSQYFITQIGANSNGTTLNGINASNLANIKLPLPPLEIQRKIVGIIDSMREIKSLRENANSIPNQMIQSVFLEMFGNPVNNSRGWNSYKLGELGSWTSGGTPSRSKPEYFQGDIPWFTAGELNDSYIWDSKEKITKEALNSSSAKLFPAETMLIGMYDTAAFKMGVLKNPASSNQACAAFFPKTEVINTFFALYLFKEMKNYFLSKRRGIRQKNLSQKIIKNFEVPVPPINLQQKFAYFVQSIEEIRHTQENSTLIINDMFNQVLDKAFKGELVC